MKNKLYFALVMGVSLASCKTNTPETTKEPLATTVSAIHNKIKPEDEAKTIVIPVAHASAIIQYNETVLCIDPAENLEAYKDYKTLDIILITDIHSDHLSPEALKLLVTPETKIIAPQAVADKIPDYQSQTIVLNNGENTKIGTIEIKAIPMYNLRKEAAKFHVKGRGNGYLLTINEERIYFSGDTEDIPEMRALKNIDRAFICMNSPYTMTVESAANAVLEFEPKQVFPYHYRGNPDVSDTDKFKKLVNAENQNIEVIQLDWYPNDDF